MKYVFPGIVLLCFISCHSQNLPAPLGPPYLLVRSSGKLTQLANSLGQDRLGSEKEGYIDTSILLKVIDSTGNLYHIQLSKYHTAYVAKTDVTADTATHLKPFYLTNTWDEKAGTNDDSLFISMDERLPYKSWMEIDPARIMIELYGVESNLRP